MYKFTSFIWFHRLISFNSPTYSIVSQIQLYYLLSRSYLILQFQHIQQCNKFNSLIWFNSIISFNTPTYSTVSQIQLSYLVLHSHLLQQSHLFNSVTNSVVLSNLSFMSYSIVPHIQLCNKFNCFISFYILIYFKSVQITSFIWFHSLI